MPPEKKKEGKKASTPAAQVTVAPPPPADDTLRAEIASLKDTLNRQQADIERVGQETANQMKSITDTLLKVRDTFTAIEQRTANTTQQIINENFNALMAKMAADREAERQARAAQRAGQDTEAPQGGGVTAGRLENAIAKFLESINSDTVLKVVEMFRAPTTDQAIAGQLLSISRWSKVINGIQKGGADAVAAEQFLIDRAAGK